MFVNFCLVIISSHWLHNWSIFPPCSYLYHHQIEYERVLPRRWFVSCRDTYQTTFISTTKWCSMDVYTLKYIIQYKRHLFGLGALLKDWLKLLILQIYKYWILNIFILYSKYRCSIPWKGILQHNVVIKLDHIVLMAWSSPATAKTPKRASRSSVDKIATNALRLKRWVCVLLKTYNTYHIIGEKALQRPLRDEYKRVNSGRPNSTSYPYNWLLMWSKPLPHLMFVAVFNNESNGLLPAHRFDS